MVFRFLASKMCTLTHGRSLEGLGDVSHVGDDGLDAVALALDLGQQTGHLVAVEGVRHGAVHVHCHCCLACWRMGTGIVEREMKEGERR